MFAKFIYHVVSDLRLPTIYNCRSSSLALSLEAVRNGNANLAFAWCRLMTFKRRVDVHGTLTLPYVIDHVKSRSPTSLNDVMSMRK